MVKIFIGCCIAVIVLIVAFFLWQKLRLRRFCRKLREHDYEILADIADYRQKYGDMWFDGFVEEQGLQWRICDDYDEDMKIINELICQGRSFCCWSTNMEHIAKARKKFEYRVCGLYEDIIVDFYREHYCNIIGDMFCFWEYKDVAPELLLQDALKTGKWEELPDELQGEYRKRIGQKLT